LSDPGASPPSRRGTMTPLKSETLGMRCPFPGMDPYLEDPAIWPDFHARMVNALCDTLLDRLPPGYDARIDERVRLVIPEGPARTRFPDVGITRRSDAPLASAPAPSPTALMEPVELPE